MENTMQTDITKIVVGYLEEKDYVHFKAALKTLSREEMYIFLRSLSVEELYLLLKILKK
jgi:hypothetical protein